MSLLDTAGKTALTHGRGTATSVKHESLWPSGVRPLTYNPLYVLFEREWRRPILNMKFLLAVLCFVFVPLSYAQSQDGSSLLNLAIAKLPPCAVRLYLRCFVSRLISVAAMHDHDYQRVDMRAYRPSLH